MPVFLPWMSNDSGWFELTIDNYWQLLIIAVSSETRAYREVLLTCLVIDLSFMFRCTPTFSHLRQLARFTRFLLVVQLIGVCIPVTVIEMAYFFRKCENFDSKVNGRPIAPSAYSFPIAALPEDSITIELGNVSYRASCVIEKAQTVLWCAILQS